MSSSKSVMESRKQPSRLARTAWMFGWLSWVGAACTFVAGYVALYLQWSLDQEASVLGSLLILGMGSGLLAILAGLLALANHRVRSGDVPGKEDATGGFCLGCVGLFMSVMLASVVHLILSGMARQKETGKLKQLGLAMHAYADTHQNALPAAEAFRTKDEKPGLSWRVALLPYLEQDDLYKQFNLDEPWDSPNNLPLLAQMPAVYRRPGQRKDASGLTHYQVFVGPGTAFERSTRVTLNIDGIPDGTSNTILVVAANTPVPWTKPDDLGYAPDKPLPPLSYEFRLGITGRMRTYITTALLADGSVQSFRQETPESTIRALITRNGGEEIQFP